MVKSLTKDYVQNNDSGCQCLRNIRIVETPHELRIYRTFWSCRELFGANNLAEVYQSLFIVQGLLISAPSLHSEQLDNLKVAELQHTL